jgi:hypothetical protein
MGCRLASLPEAHDLVCALGLPRRETSLYAAMRVGGTGAAPDGLVSILMLAGQTSLRRRIAYISGKLFPPAAMLEERYPIARRGAAGLGLARAARFASCAIGLPRALAAWRGSRVG